jgi:hypothetical protein
VRWHRRVDPGEPFLADHRVAGKRRRDLGAEPLLDEQVDVGDYRAVVLELD